MGSVDVDLPVLIDVSASLASFHTGQYEQSYKGLRVWKHLADLDRYREVIAATRPDVLVETGTKFGGSALWFADEMDVDVITVDIEPEPSRKARERGHGRITWLTGSSIAPAVVDQVAALVAGRRTMVVLDSDHHTPHVRAEIAAYGPLVTPGCYLVVEDAIFDLAVDPEEARRGGRSIPEVGGALPAIRETLAADPGWRRDEAIECLHTVSYYPAGWWVRCG